MADKGPPIPKLSTVHNPPVKKTMTPAPPQRASQAQQGKEAAQCAQQEPAPYPPAKVTNPVSPTAPPAQVPDPIQSNAPPAHVPDPIQPYNLPAHIPNPVLLPALQCRYQIQCNHN